MKPKVTRVDRTWLSWSKSPQKWTFYIQCLHANKSSCPFLLRNMPSKTNAPMFIPNATKLMIRFAALELRNLLWYYIFSIASLTLRHTLVSQCNTILKHLVLEMSFLKGQIPPISAGIVTIISPTDPSTASGKIGATMKIKHPFRVWYTVYHMRLQLRFLI